LTIAGADPTDTLSVTHTVDTVRSELAQVQLKLKGIEDISKALGSEHNIDRILDTVMEKTTELMDAERATLFVVADRTQTLWSRNTQGGEVAKIEVPIGTGIAGWVAANGRTVNVKDAYKDSRFDSSFDLKTGFRTQSVLCAPLRDSQRRTIGVIQVLNKRSSYFTPADEDLLAAIASQAAISIHNSRLYLDIVGKNIELTETSMRLNARKAELELLFKIERAAATAITLEAALEGVTTATLAEFPSEAAAVMLLEPDGSTLKAALIAGDHGSDLVALIPSMTPALVLEVMTSGQAKRAQFDLLEADGWRARHGIAAPIVQQSETLGCLILVNREDNPRGFEVQDERMLSVIGSRLGLSVVLARALEEEQKAERLSVIGQALSGVIHDLKTPLTIIGGYARAMVREDNVETRKVHREKVKKQISLLKEMTGELLSFARGESELYLRKVFIRAFLDELSELLQEEFADSGVELVVEDTFGGAVKMDENKMKRVTYNLARNAREAMPDGGVFTIRVSADDDAVAMAFQDNGPGIPRELEGRLFESFATHGKANGTGLGLAIVKGLVEAHRGTVNVSSILGEGTTFTISLPR
jgi:signal transduction histidine kinase/putative methionine-R-sulfoxide reductase with GAF domain